MSEIINFFRGGRGGEGGARSLSFTEKLFNVHVWPASLSIPARTLKCLSLREVSALTPHKRVNGLISPATQQAMSSGVNPTKLCFSLISDFRCNAFSLYNIKNIVIAIKRPSLIKKCPFYDEKSLIRLAAGAIFTKLFMTNS